MIFSSLDLAPELQKAVDACGYKTMTPIQEKAIIPARRGTDLLACAQTGTGKTATFTLPVLQQMLDKYSEAAQENRNGRPQALVLTPTRELAEQLATTIGSYAQFTNFNIVSVYGGGKMSGQESKLKGGVDLLIATPGRLLEHIAQCNVDLSKVEFVVLDEADRMLDMGFVEDVVAIINSTAKQRQTLLFSATLSAGINELAHKVLTHHQEIRTSKKANVTADTVKHVIYAVEESRKIDLFMDLLEEHNWYQVLVFTSTTHQADKLQERLKKKRVDSDVCHGDKRQNARRRALADFKSGKLQVLIATEVAARGIDIEGLDYVINYNLPFLAEDYVHRIGRTGRAGQQGNAISFVSREEERSVDTIQRMIGSKIERIHRHGFEVSDRRSLITKISQKKLSGRANKASKTNIEK